MSLDKNDERAPRRPRPGPCPKCGSRSTIATPDPNAPCAFEGSCDDCGHDFPLTNANAAAKQRAENEQARADAVAMKKLAR